MKNIIYLIKRSVIFMMLVFISGCASKKIPSEEEIKKQLINFKVPEKPKKGKGMIYIIHDYYALPGAREIITFCGKIDKEE